MLIELRENGVDEGQLFTELRQLALAHPLTANIETFLIHPAFPVDIRHNAKIFREQLAVWAEERLGTTTLAGRNS